MSQILATFGIDWRLLIINAVNFALLMLALWYFLYAPVTKMLEQRRRKVSDGVRDAESAKRTLQEVEAARAGKLAEAGKVADSIVMQARQAGSAKEKELVERAEAASAALVTEAEAQARELKAEAIAESKQEVAKLIVLGIEKAL